MIVHIHKYNIGDYVQLNEHAKVDLPDTYNKKTIGIIKSLILDSLSFDYYVSFNGDEIKVKEKEIFKLNKFSLGEPVKSNKYYQGFTGMITSMEYTNYDFGYGVTFKDFDIETWFWEGDLIYVNEENDDQNIQNKLMYNAFQQYKQGDTYVIPKNKLNKLINEIIEGKII